MVDRLNRGAYLALNGRPSWRVFLSVDGSPAVTRDQIEKSAGVGTTVAGVVLDAMEKANMLIHKEGCYLDELGTELLAASQHVDIKRTNRRWAVYRKQRGEYRTTQRRYNRGQSDVILYLRMHGFDAFPAMGIPS